MLSTTWAFGPPIGMKAPQAVIPIRQPTERNLLLIQRKSRFLVGRRGDLLGMTGLDDFRGSVAKHLLYLIEDKQKPILRCAQDDIVGGSFRSLLG